MCLDGLIFVHHHGFSQVLSWFLVLPDMLHMHNDSVSRFQVGSRQYRNVLIVYGDNRLYILPNNILIKSWGVVSDSFYQNSFCALCCPAVLHFAMAHEQRWLLSPAAARVDHINNASCFSCFPVSSHSIPVSYRYYSTAHIHPRSTYSCNLQTCTQTGKLTGTLT